MWEISWASLGSECTSLVLPIHWIKLGHVVTRKTVSLRERETFTCTTNHGLSHEVQVGLIPPSVLERVLCGLDQSADYIFLNAIVSSESGK